MDLGKLVSFEGRIGRGEFWGISILNLFVLLIGELLIFKAGSAGIAIGVVLMLAGFIVSLTTQTKRWHDRGKSGWWMLIAFVPFGGLWALVETGILGGTAGSNQYGMPDSGSPFAQPVPASSQPW